MTIQIPELDHLKPDAPEGSEDWEEFCTRIMAVGIWMAHNNRDTQYITNVLWMTDSVRADLEGKGYRVVQNPNDREMIAIKWD